MKWQAVLVWTRRTFLLVCKYEASSSSAADRLTLQRKVGHYETQPILCRTWSRCLSLPSSRVAGQSNSLLPKKARQARVLTSTSQGHLEAALPACFVLHGARKETALFQASEDFSSRNSPLNSLCQSCSKHVPFVRCTKA